MMTQCQRLLVLVVLGYLVGTPILAQAPGDPVVLRVAHATRSDRLNDLDASRREAAFRFLAVADKIQALPDGSGRERRELLANAQELADRIVFLDEEIAVATPAVREARRGLTLALEAGIASDRRAAREADPQTASRLEGRIREREAELARLHAANGRDEAPDPLASAGPALTSFARVVVEEHARVMKLHTLHDELRLFLGNLRLFDDTGMPPSARTDGGGDPDAGCPVSGCPFTGFSPADVPMAYVRQDDTDRRGAGAVALTPASLARLRQQLAAYADLRGLSAEVLAMEARTVTRETVVGAGIMTFRGVSEGIWGLGPKAGTALFLSRGLGAGMHLTVEPSLGGRSVRTDPSTVAEVAAEVRTTLAGESGNGGLSWRAMSWQKGRFLSDQLPLPGYLEPGRMEGGLATRLAVPLRDGWDVVLASGGDVVRYEPEEWKVLDRQGLNASMGVAWYGESRSGRVSLLASRQAFPNPGLEWGPRREDTRVGVEADGTFEGNMVTRVSAGLAWNDSRIPEYDFRSARAALVLAAPWGSGSVQAYAALAHQAYLNPGAGETRIAVSDQDTGSILAVQLNRPLSPSRTLILRAEWSRSESGFRDDFYNRFGTSVQMTFRDRPG